MVLAANQGTKYYNKIAKFYFSLRQFKCQAFSPLVQISLVYLVPQTFPPTFLFHISHSPSLPPSLPPYLPPSLPPSPPSLPPSPPPPLPPGDGGVLHNWRLLAVPLSAMVLLRHWRRTYRERTPSPGSGQPSLPTLPPVGGASLDF